VAERIVAKLRRKMTRFALMVARDLPPERAAEHDLMNEAYEALVSLGHSAPDARKKLEAVTDAGKKFKSVEELLTEIYRQERK
jgi:Holliday junction DNA helicase RuvA